MTIALTLPPDLSSHDYLVIGIATCFRREEEETTALEILEPIPSAYLEALLQGIPTTYRWVQGTTLGNLPDVTALAAAIAVSQVQVCENFQDRAIAAARTYQARPGAAALLGTDNPRTDLNYSTEKKRVLNLKTVVKTEDNVRQHEYTHKRL